MINRITEANSLFQAAMQEHKVPIALKLARDCGDILDYGFDYALRGFKRDVY